MSTIISNPITNASSNVDEVAGHTLGKDITALP